MAEPDDPWLDAEKLLPVDDVRAAMLDALGAEDDTMPEPPVEVADIGAAAPPPHPLTSRTSEAAATWAPERNSVLITR